MSDPNDNQMDVFDFIDAPETQMLENFFTDLKNSGTATNIVVVKPTERISEDSSVIECFTKLDDLFKNKPYSEILFADGTRVSVNQPLDSTDRAVLSAVSTLLQRGHNAFDVNDIYAIAYPDNYSDSSLLAREKEYKKELYERMLKYLETTVVISKDANKKITVQLISGMAFQDIDDKLYAELNNSDIKIEANLVYKYGFVCYDLPHSSTLAKAFNYYRKVPSKTLTDKTKNRQGYETSSLLGLSINSYIARKMEEAKIKFEGGEIKCCTCYISCSDLYALASDDLSNGTKQRIRTRVENKLKSLVQDNTITNFTKDIRNRNHVVSGYHIVIRT